MFGFKVVQLLDQFVKLDQCHLLGLLFQLFATSELILIFRNQDNCDELVRLNLDLSPRFLLKTDYFTD